MPVQKDLIQADEGTKAWFYDRWFFVKDAAEILDLSEVRVVELIEAGRLPAEKVTQGYWIDGVDLWEFKRIPRYAGRPLKSNS